MRPLSFAPISGRRHPASRILPWAAPSLAFHAILVLPTLVTLATSPAGDERPAHEVLFLAPLLPKPEPASEEAKESAPLPGLPSGWSSVASAVTGTDAAIGLTVGRGTSPSSALQRAQQDLASPPVPDSASKLVDENVYQAVDVDREVAREADAVAPIYPEQLRLTNVMGGVTVQFVVDTMGHVEEGSLHVVGATHPLFAAAVRDAAPQMRFRPAIRSGRLVRQQVVQSFHFVLTPPAADTVAVKKRP